MEIVGRQIELGLGVENFRGNTQDAAEKWLKNVTANVVEKSEKAIDDNSHGVLEDSDGSRVTKKWIEGDLEGIVQVDPIGFIIYNLYGTDTESTLETGVYQHIMTMAQSIQHASLSIFAKDGDVQQRVFNNCMVGVLGLTATIDDYVRFTTGFMGKEAAANTDSPSYTTERDFIGKDITVKVATTEAGLTSAVAKKVKELSINFDQGLIADHILGQYAPDDVYNSKMTIEGEITLNFADEVFKDLFLADTAQYMEIKIEGEELIGDTEKASITILLNKMQVQDWNRSGANDELVTEVVSFKGFYNETDDQQSKITIVNNTEEYDSPQSS